MSAPLSTPFETMTRDVFHALMHALANPGRPQPLPAVGCPFEALAAVGQTLLDLETSYYTSDHMLAARLTDTGARSRPASAAEYHFYARIDGTALAAIGEAAAGTLADPEKSACIIAGAFAGSQQELRITGPGVKAVNRCVVQGVPAAFWEVRAQRMSFPLGWDAFLLTEAGVIGLPRSTSVEVGGA